MCTSHIRVGSRELPARAYVSSFNFRGTDQQKLVGALSGGSTTTLQDPNAGVGMSSTGIITSSSIQRPDGCTGAAMSVEFSGGMGWRSRSATPATSAGLAIP